MPHVAYTRDDLGVCRTEDGSLLDLRAGAYDTCVTLGQDPMYARSTMLPEKVHEYYAPHGDEVVEAAVLGWMRGRQFSMKEPWQKFVAPDRGVKRRRKTVSSTKPKVASSTEPVSQDWHPLDLLIQRGARPSTTSSTRTAPALAGHAEAVDVNRVLITPAVVKSLSKELKAALKEHLQPQEWQPIDKGDRSWDCRYVSDVLRTLRLRSTNGLSGPWTLLASDLRRELAWHRPTLTGSRTYRPEDL